MTQSRSLATIEKRLASGVVAIVGRMPGSTGRPDRSLDHARRCLDFTCVPNDTGPVQSLCSRNLGRSTSARSRGNKLYKAVILGSPLQHAALPHVTVTSIRVVWLSTLDKNRHTVLHRHRNIRPRQGLPLIRSLTRMVIVLLVTGSRARSGQIYGAAPDARKNRCS